MDFESIAAWGGMVLALVGYGYWFWRSNAKDRDWAAEWRRVTYGVVTAPRATVADFPSDRVATLVGTVRHAGRYLTAPLSERKCVCYESFVMRLSGEDDWHLVAREKRGVPFLIVDEAGHRALVDPDGALVCLDTDYHDDNTGPNSAQRSLLRRHRMKVPTSTFFGRQRYGEGILDVGERVAVSGFGVHEPDPDGASAVRGYRDGPPMRLRLTSSRRFPLLITDKLDRLDGEG